MSLRTKYTWLIVASFLWALSGWNYANADIEGYIDDYSMSMVSAFLEQYSNPGWFVMVQFFLDLNISFKVFHIIFFGVSMCFFTYVAFRYSKAPFTVVFLYMITAFFGDIIQMKNTIAIIFLYIGLIVLLNNNIKYRKIIYSIFILIASTFHIAFSFYFVFLLCDIKITPKRFIPLCIIASVVGKPVLGLLSNNSLVQGSFFLMERQDQYMDSYSWGALLLCSLQYILHYFVCKKYLQIESSEKFVNRQRLLNINILLALLLVFSALSATFFRLFRNLLLFNSVFIINGYISMHRSKRNLALLLLYFVVVSLANFILTPVFDNVPIILSNNYLW